MKEIEEWLEPIEAEHVVMFVLHWIAMRYFGMIEDLAFGGSDIATYIDEMVVIIAFLISLNIGLSAILKLYQLYHEREKQKPTWEKYEPQMQDLREAYGMGKDVLRRFETPNPDNYIIREVQTDEGKDYELLKE